MSALTAMTWQGGPVLIASCLAALIIGFVLNRWWSIPIAVVAWVIYVEFVYPRTTTVTPQPQPFKTLLENLSVIELFGTSILIGASAAVGFGCREAMRRSRTETD